MRQVSWIACVQPSKIDRKNVKREWSRVGMEMEDEEYQSTSQHGGIGRLPRRMKQSVNLEESFALS